MVYLAVGTFGAASVGVGAMSRMKDLFGDEIYPEAPGFTDLNTSREAAKKVEPKASGVREDCYTCILHSRDGMTADQVALRLDKSVLYIRPRLSELFAAGRIIKTTRRRKNRSGLSAAIYVVPNREAKL